MFSHKSDLKIGKSEFSPKNNAVSKFWQNEPTRVFYVSAHVGKKAIHGKTIFKRYTQMNKIFNKLALFFGLALAGVGSAFAAVDAAVTTALTSAGTDAGTIAIAVFVVLVAIYAVKLMRKAL